MRRTDVLKGQFHCMDDTKSPWEKILYGASFDITDDVPEGFRPEGSLHLAFAREPASGLVVTLALVGDTGNLRTNYTIHTIRSEAEIRTGVSEGASYEVWSRAFLADLAGFGLTRDMYAELALKAASEITL